MGISLFRKKPDTFDYDVSRVCKVCGTTFHGRFCPRCGEKVLEPRERSFFTFLDSLLNAFTALDGKFVNSLKLLATRPGQLSLNISNGIRVPYMKMVSLFFVANFFYFFLSFWDSYNSRLFTQMENMGRGGRATRMVNERLEKEHITLAEFTEKYEAQSTNLSKLLLVLLALLFTMALMVICFSRKILFFDHLLFSMEYFSFHIIVNLIIITYLLYGIIVVAGWMKLDARFILEDQFFSMIAWTTSAYFLVRGLINFYQQRWYWAVPKAVVLFFLLQVMVDVYRRMLFFVTMWTL